jgi:hypothetical protein
VREASPAKGEQPQSSSSAPRTGQWNALKSDVSRALDRDPEAWRAVSTPYRLIDLINGIGLRDDRDPDPVPSAGHDAGAWGRAHSSIDAALQALHGSSPELRDTSPDD